MNSDGDENFVHIDGDVLDLDMATVLKLGDERNPYTLWQIYKNLIENRIPVLSTGGGCLVTFGKESKFILFENIKKIFEGHKVDFNITILLPNEETKIINNDNRDKIYEYLGSKTLYNIEALFKEYKAKLSTIIDERNERNKILGNLGDIINDDSKDKMLKIDNKEIVRTIIDSCMAHVKENNDSIINFLFYNKDYSYKELLNQTNYEIFKPILNKINTPNINITAMFKQRRILCKYTKPLDNKIYYHHVTLEFAESKNSIQINSEDENYKKKIVGNYIILFNKKYIDQKNSIKPKYEDEINNSIEDMNKKCDNNYSLYNNLKSFIDIKNTVSKISKGKHELLPILAEMSKIIGKTPEDQVFEIIKIKNDANLYHITVNSSIFSPVTSTIVLEKIKNGNDEILLTKKNKDKEIDMTFYYDNVEHKFVVEFINVFYMPAF
jgi:hypothetical protein